MAKQKIDKRTNDYKDNQLGTVVRISTSYLVEVTEEDLEIIREYSLDDFILNDLRTKRKLVEEGKSAMRKTTESVWNDVFGTDKIESTATSLTLAHFLDKATKELGKINKRGDMESRRAFHIDNKSTFKEKNG